jgi:hypothetical protein
MYIAYRNNFIGCPEIRGQTVTILKAITIGGTVGLLPFNFFALGNGR